MKYDALYAAGVVYLRRDLEQAMFSSLPEHVMYFRYLLFSAYIWRKKQCFSTYAEESVKYKLGFFWKFSMLKNKYNTNNVCNSNVETMSP